MSKITDLVSSIDIKWLSSPCCLDLLLHLS